ncbi:hypothetical protein N9K40_02635 [Candidatus Pelagibacter sp.]|nr:hypothetical protein [Candidatus Pelagibacter sp.]
MIKTIIKTLSVIFLLLIIIVFYLSSFGIKTKKFNNQIASNILKINKKINLSLDQVNYLLNPYNLTINIKTKNPKISLSGTELRIKDIKTNVSLKSLMYGQFLIDDLQITTKEIKLNDVISLARSFQNSPQLSILHKMTKGGFITANIKLNFDEIGKIKENYKIIGSVKKSKFNFLNQLRLQNLNFDFDISKNNFLLKKIDTEINNIKITSPLIKVKKDKDLFFANGQILNDTKNFNIQEFKQFFDSLSKNINLKKIDYSSIHNFSFNVNKNLKFNDLKVETILNLKELILKGKHLKLKPYFTNFVEEIKLKKHKIIINYKKNIFHIKGNGNILLEDKSDILSYEIIKNKNNLSFDTKINLKNNSLLIDFLDYEKKVNLNSLLLIKGSLNEDYKPRFDLISLKEKNNEILIKGLYLSKNFKIIDIDNFNINYKNNKKILNKLNLKKNNSNFIIEGESFDASKIINNIINDDEKDSSIFQSLKSKIKVRIKKTFINQTNYINNLYGTINFDNNKINYLKLESTFPNKKKINLSIKTNNSSETITKLFSAYPKPLIKRYDFIKGFEEGYLDFYSSKKGDVSNSVLIINDFKVKKVPVFAKLLSLASLQGIADLLTGEGIRFTNFEMNFSNQKGLTTINEMYAIGPAVSILMDGYIETKKLVSLRGTLVPATTINRSIASIPVLGKILIGDKTGEGVFGVSFKIKGPPKDLKTKVNPIKSLTPRFITRTLENIKKN